MLTVNEKRAALGFSPIAGGDVILVPKAMMPFGEASVAGGQGEGAVAADADDS